MYRRIFEWFESRGFGGHWSCGPLVVYGFNAMHCAVNLQTPWGWLCFKPATWCFGKKWASYLYFSADATPCRPDMKWGIFGRDGERTV